MKQALAALLAAAALAALGAAPASAAFGLKDLELSFEGQDGSPAVQAGSHPYVMSTVFNVNSTTVPGLGEVPDESIKDATIEFPPGFIGDTTAVPACPTAEFIDVDRVTGPGCAPDAAVGIAYLRIGFEGPGNSAAAIYNLEPGPGVPAKLGLNVLGVPITFDVGLNPEPPSNVRALPTNIPQPLRFYGSRVEIWGHPTSALHDDERAVCAYNENSCPTIDSHRAYLTVPRSCDGPLVTRFEADSWQHPGQWLRYDVQSPDRISGCASLGFAPRATAAPTTSRAETGSGLDFDLDFTDEGLANPEGYADSDIKKAVVRLPEGVTINPSAGEGLGVCTPAQLDRETAFSAPGEGCPESSVIGTVSARSPIVSEALEGRIFLAPQDDPATAAAGAENPFDSLIAFYLVVRNAKLGAIVKRAALVEPDPRSGRLVTTVDEIPQFPLSHVNVHLRTGERAALITPPACGVYETEADLYPWANPGRALPANSSFEIDSGVGGGPCPAGGAPPFSPGFQAGSLNNNAGSFSPFHMRLTRSDGEQDMTRFSSVLPPGVLGSLAGLGRCSDAAIAAAKAKTGREELAAASCPTSAEIGRTLAGAGVGEALTYVGGRIYLAGPHKGAPLSVVAITPAVAGPFDAGTVVVRLGLTLNPKTAEVEVDGASSDPIPHILQGIVLKVRDIRVYVDRPDFTLNPTSCDPSEARATLFGSYLDVFDPGDDLPVALATRYQAANCLNLGFRPRLNLRLKGGTRRGAFPALRAVYTPRRGDANLAAMVVRLPRSAFLEQGHIGTICTRVQFAADACPKRSRYGYIRAWTPLLDEPLQGPVYLRSSSHNLPDLVFDLKGIVDIEVATRIDSVRGGIRARVLDAPDAPISRVLLRMQGGRKGLIVNSRNLCARPARAGVRLLAHNGRLRRARAPMRTRCAKKRRVKQAGARRHSR